MHDLSLYQIQIKGQMDEVSFNRTSPLQIRITESDKDLTSFSIFTDQSGLIGLLRHLHHQGYHLLGVELK